MSFLKKSITKISFIICIAMTISLPVFAKTNLEGVFTPFPGADIYNAFPGEQLSKAISTPRYNYFVIRGRSFRKSSKSVSTIELDGGREFNALYRFDRYNPSKGMYCANEEVPLNGTLVQTIQYSPESEALVVAYVDCTIDIVSDAGGVTSISVIKNLNLPSEQKINSITFSSDGKRFYVCHDLGMCEFETSTGNCLRNIYNTERAPHYAAPLGDNIVWVAKDEQGVTQIFVTPADCKPEFKTEKALFNSTPANFTHTACLNSVKGINEPQTLLPLTAETLLLTAQVGTSSYCPILLTLDDIGQPRLLHLVNLTYTNAQAGTDVNVTHSYPLENLTSNYSDGYLLNSNAAIMLIKKNFNPDLTLSDPSAEFCKKNIIYLSKSNIPAKVSNEADRMLASWDGKEFIIHNTKVGFFRRTMTRTDDALWNAGVTWSSASENIPLNGCPLAVPSTITYNPNKGMMFLGNQFDNRTVNSLVDQPSNICAFKDGKWEYLDTYPTNYSSRLVTRGRGLTPDPLDANFIYSTHYYYGLIRRDLSNPNDFVIMGAPNISNLNSLPGYIPETFEGLLDKSTYYNFSLPVFDAENNLWLAAHYPNAYKNFYLLWWDAESRKACGNLYADHSLIQDNGFKTIKIENNNPATVMQILPCRTEGYTNILAFSPHSYINASNLFFYDHNGTKEDTSDDRVVQITDFRIFGVNDRISNTYYFTYFIGEDTARGEIWIMTDKGPFIAKLSELFSGDPVLYPVVLEDEGADAEILQMSQCQYIQIDPQGRKWIGAPGGLFCISADNKKLLGYWNSENSPITNDRIMALGIDPTNNDVWFSTFGTLYRFQPAGSSDSKVVDSLISCIPETLTPEYHGVMTFRGLADGIMYDIRNSEGKIIATLPSAKSGVSIWHPEKVRNTLKTGEYHITGPEGAAIFTFRILN